MHHSFIETDKRLRRMMVNLGEQAPDMMGAFSQLHRVAVGDGALSPKVKELMALAISIHARCDGCIAYHVRDALKADATRREILETVGVAVLMGGGPSLVYATDALEALDEFEAT